MFDATLVRKCEEALFYSAVDQEHAFHYSARSDRSSAEQQVDALDPSDRQPGHDVRALLVATNATMWNAARGVRPSLAVSLTHVGAGARALLYTRIRDAGAEVEADATQVCAQLDTRPTQLAMAAEMAARMIEDPSRRDLWYTGVIALAPDIVRDGKRAWFYQLTGNLTGLRAMAVDRRSSTDERAIALEYIAEGGDVEFASREFPKLMEETAYAPFSAYAGFLNEHRQWKEKEAAARRGLELSETEGGIPEAYYASSLADALEEQGRYAEAWRVVKPRMGVWSANIISGAISLLQRLGRVAESDELAGQYLDRYPDTSSRVEYAIVLWRQRRFDEAAKLFDSKTTANNEAEWSKWMPEAFERHISDTPTAIAVFEALHRAGVSDELLVVIPRALVRKQPAIAVALMEKLRDRARPAGYGEEAAIAEFNARIASNDPKAMESLRAATKDDAVDSMLLALLRKGYYEAALHVGTDRPAVSQDERCLYLSLALIGAHAARDDPRFAALRRTLEAQPLTASAGSPQHAARYATGIIDLHEADRLATIPKGRSILDFVIGLQLAADGNYDAALPHILAASQRSRELSVPQALAIDLLMRWSNASAPWPEVARRRIL